MNKKQKEETIITSIILTKTILKKIKLFNKIGKWMLRSFVMIILILLSYQILFNESSSKINILEILVYSLFTVGLVFYYNGFIYIYHEIMKGIDL